MRRKASLNDAGNEWLAHLEARGSASDTVRNRTITLKQLRDITGDIQLDNLTHRHIDRWRSAYAWSPATANRKVAEVKAFLSWCRARGYLSPTADPMHGYANEKVPTKTRLRIPVDEWGTVLDAAPHPLERILVACGFYLMARSSELRSIRLRDVDLEAGEITVYRQKVRRHDTLPICSELDIELRRWLTWYHQTAQPGPESYLLPNRSKSQTVRDPRTGRLVRLKNDARVNPLEPIDRPHRHVQMVLKPLGYDIAQEGGHTLRRSAARAYFDELAETGYDGALRRVQAMLDHSSSITTEGYLGLNLDKEQRNKALRGKPMFRQHAEPAGNVVPLRRDGTDG